MLRLLCRTVAIDSVLRAALGFPDAVAVDARRQPGVQEASMSLLQET